MLTAQVENNVIILTLVNIFVNLITTWIIL